MAPCICIPRYLGKEITEPVIIWKRTHGATTFEITNAAGKYSIDEY